MPMARRCNSPSPRRGAPTRSSAWWGSARARRTGGRISGYATEAARALIDAFFAYTPQGELTSSARVINPGSRRVVEKCGFAYQGTGLMTFPARGGLFPVDQLRLDRRAWESLKSWSHTGFVPHPKGEAMAEFALAAE
jgi:RimJ/RimL family protein N-acetyltransferase